MDLIVKKSNLLVSSQLASFSATQIKLFNYFVSRVGDGSSVFCRYSDLFFACGYDGKKAHSFIKKDLLDLLRRSEILVSDCDSGEYWLTCFTKAHFQKLGNDTGIRVSFLSDVVPFLQDCRSRYTSYFFNSIRLLKSEYSIRLFELMIQMKNSDHKSRVLSVSEFRQLMLIDDHKYKAFKSLNSAVIKRSITDISINSGMDLSVKKEGDILTIKIDKLPDFVESETKNLFNFDLEACQKILNFSKKQFLELIEICGLDLLNESLRYLKQVIIRAKAKKSETNEFALAKHVLFEDLHVIKEKAEKRKQGDALAQSKAQDEQTKAAEQEAKAAREQKYQDFINSDDLENQLYIISENFNYDLVNSNLPDFKVLDSDSLSLYNLSFNELDVVDMLDILSQPVGPRHIRFSTLKLAIRKLILSCLI